MVLSKEKVIVWNVLLIAGTFILSPISQSKLHINTSVRLEISILTVSKVPKSACACLKLTVETLEQGGK